MATQDRVSLCIIIIITCFILLCMLLYHWRLDSYPFRRRVQHTPLPILSLPPINYMNLEPHFKDHHSYSWNVTDSNHVWIVQTNVVFFYDLSFYSSWFIYPFHFLENYNKSPSPERIRILMFKIIITNNILFFNYL